ncbi:MULTISPECIES: hypothetical protein [unclassified Variovorax]|uniref:hypothetical protein n=1 Tax=unclassified Variovorax TaxID=663243 RepID=UPI003F490261
MAAALSERTVARPGSQRYWAPCLAVALVAMCLFYVALTDLLKDRAAHAPVPVSAVPAVVQPPLAGGGADDAMPVYGPASSGRAYIARDATRVAPALSPVVATPVRLAVTKCVSSSGTAEYSDGPCAEGSQASTTLQLQ